MNTATLFETYVNELYKNMFKSQKSDSWKKEALSLLLREYESKIEQGKSVSEAISSVIGEFGSEEDIRAILNYEIDNNIQVDKNSVQHYIKYIRILSLLFGSSVSLLATLMFGLRIYDIPVKIVLCTISFLGIMGAAFIYKRKPNLSYQQNFFDHDTYKYIGQMYSIYGRKLINSLIELIAYIIFSAGAFVTSFKFQELSLHDRLALSNPWIICIGIFLMAVNTVKFICMKQLYEQSNNKRIYHALRKCVRWSFTYMLIVALVRLVCQMNHIELPLWMFAMASIIYLFIFTAIFLLLRKTYLVDVSKINIWKKTVAITLVVVAVLNNIMINGSWILQPYISTIPTVAHTASEIAYEEGSGKYSIRMEEDEFKILQITDIHLGGSILSSGKDKKALEAVYVLIDNAKPDMVVVTGDFVFPLGLFSFSLNNYTPLIQFAAFMRNIGIPWAFVYGNHDTEVVATHSSDQLNEMFSHFSFEKSSSNLLYTEKQPDITGRSNQVIEILNKDGSINQALYLLDSNSYASNDFTDYDYIHDDQVQWYEDSVSQLSQQQGETISSLMFFHIPIKEYQVAYDLYKEKSRQVAYYFGEIGEDKQAICASKYDTKLFDKIVELNSTKGIFVGHDHYNNISLEYKNVRLTYGMSIDYLAMPGIYNRTRQRGATLITLHKDSSFDVEQIRLTDILQ